MNLRSVWCYLRYHQYKFRNLLYLPGGAKGTTSNVLIPKSEVRDLLLWRDVYVSEQRSGPGANSAPAAAAAAAAAGADRSQSGDSSQNESEGESTDNGREFAPVKEAEFQKQKV